MHITKIAISLTIIKIKTYLQLLWNQKDENYTIYNC